MKTEYDKDLSIIIPVYNSENSLDTLCETLARTLGEKFGNKYEIILIDDCSSDNSWKVAKSLAEKSDTIRSVCLNRNYGQHNALLCGMRCASGSVIATMDDDLQHPASELPLLLNELAKGYDVVYGTPLKQNHNFTRSLASKITKRVLQRAMGAETAGSVSAFRVFRKSLCQSFDNYQGPNVNIDIMLAWSTNRFSAIQVRHEPRKHGTTGYTFTKLIQHAMNMVTGFTTLPLQVASYMGILFSLFGFGVLCYTFITYLIYGTVVQGFAFLASIISIFSGAQLLTIGIIGEYLARIHSRTMNKPSYTVREKI